VEVSTVYDIIRGIEFSLELRNELGQSNCLAVFPSPEGNVAWLDYLAREEGLESPFDE
jgi:hypothetical protein